MTATVEDPRLIETPTGWLAVTASGDYPRIGVVGDSEAHARENYAASKAAWLALPAGDDTDA